MSITSHAFCFEIDEPVEVFDYGRFECDSGLAYRSVILFGRIQAIDDLPTKQRFCEALMTKYGKPNSGASERLFPTPRCDHGLRNFPRSDDRQGTGSITPLAAMARAKHDQNAACERAGRVSWKTRPDEVTARTTCELFACRFAAGLV